MTKGCRFARGVQDNVQHTALVAIRLQLPLLPLGGSRRIPQTLPSSVSTPRWSGTQRSFARALPEQISEFVSAASPHAWQTHQHHLWRLSNWAFMRNQLNTWGDANKVAVLTATFGGSPPLGNIALRYPSRRKTGTPSMTWHTH